MLIMKLLSTEKTKYYEKAQSGKKNSYSINESLFKVQRMRERNQSPKLGIISNMQTDK